jgi:hypothetical protein
MARHIGGFVGFSTDPTNTINSAGAEGIWDMVQQNFYILADKWPRYSQTVPVSATGGTIVTSPTHKYHVFASTGELTWTGPSNAGGYIDVLMVAGGGGSGAPLGAGGGAGGVVTYDNFLFGSPIIITVGGGGAAATPTNTPASGSPGRRGGDTTFNGSGVLITARGGGGGARYDATSVGTDQTPGGSGGGRPSSIPGGGESLGTSTQSTYNSTLLPISGFAQYGNPGGQAYPGDPYSNGGGGSGTAGSGGNPSDGGAGRAFPAFPGPLFSPAIPAPSITEIAPQGYFGGGGGGGGRSSSGIGGVGGGGNGGGRPGAPPSFGTGENGFANTGGGAGGGQYTTIDPNGLAVGGSGVCIIRYPLS